MGRDVIVAHRAELAPLGLVRRVRTALTRLIPKRRRLTKTSAKPGRVSYAELRTLSPQELVAKLSEADPAVAARWVEAAAHHGVHSALIQWGQMLLDGYGTTTDRAAAFRWFKIAADAGMDEGINMVGRCYEFGWGVPCDHAEAARWYRRAADRGFAWAQFNLAEMLLEGRGIPTDRGQARLWYLRAARQRHAKAMNMIGRYREEGWDCAPRPTLARRWYQRAAEAGDFRGQFNHARLLMWDGKRDEGLASLRRAIDGAIPDFLQTIAEDLAASDDPDLRAMGTMARQRIADDPPRHA